MLGQYIPFSDDWGIVGYHYVCPECSHVTQFRDCEEGCEKCEYSEPYEDPNDWFEAKMKY